jgi:serine-type D-Ala-D-Ala carboxypeptidase (penicillin-binding protein 5/6)
MEQRIYNAMLEVKSQVPLPFVSAESWCILDTDSGGKMVQAKLPNFKREVASLNKMMTFAAAWQVYQRYFPESTTVSIEVPKYCTEVIGTSAFLKKRDTLTMH